MPTSDVPTKSEWSRILLPKVHLIRFDGIFNWTHANKLQYDWNQDMQYLYDGNCIWRCLQNKYWLFCSDLSELIHLKLWKKNVSSYEKYPNFVFMFVNISVFNFPTVRIMLLNKKNGDICYIYIYLDQWEWYHTMKIHYDMNWIYTVASAFSSWPLFIETRISLIVFFIRWILKEI